MTTRVLDGPLQAVGSHIDSPDISSVYEYTVPAGAITLQVQNTGTEAIRIRFDGEDPSSSSGLRLTPEMGWHGLNVAPGQVIKFIREASGADLDGQAFGEADVDPI